MTSHDIEGCLTAVKLRATALALGDAFGTGDMLEKVFWKLKASSGWDPKHKKEVFHVLEMISAVQVEITPSQASFNEFVSAASSLLKQ